MLKCSLLQRTLKEARAENYIPTSYISIYNVEVNYNVHVLSISDLRISY